MSKKINNSDSQNDVITTIAHVLGSFKTLVNDEMPNIPMVYTEELGFDEALKKLISDNNYNGDTASQVIPFFAYNRTILRKTQELHSGERASKKIGCVRVGDESIQYAMTLGEFDIQFIYASNNIQLSEQFEVVYNSDEGISGTKELIVDMADLGEFKYFLDYQDLTEKTINHQDTYYKLIIGSIIVRGFYFTFRSSSGIIKEINQRIISSRNLATDGDDEVIGNIQIT